MATAAETRHIPVKEVSKPGIYRISTDPGETYHSYIGGGYKQWPEDFFVPGNPTELPKKILDEIRRAYPGSQRMNFQAAKFYEGKVEPVELDYEPWPLDEKSYYPNLSDLVDFDGHITSVGFNSEYQRGDFTRVEKLGASVRLEDKGSLRIVKNKLEFAPSARRDSAISVHIDGYRPNEDGKSRIVGFITLDGEHRGEFIETALELLNKYITENDHPLWYKPS